MKDTKGFTLIEVVAVLVILAMLMLVFFKVPLELITLSRETSHDTEIYRDGLNIRKSIMKDLSNSREKVVVSGDEIEMGNIRYNLDKSGEETKLIRTIKDNPEGTTIASRKGLDIHQDDRLLIIDDRAGDGDIELKFNIRFSSFHKVYEGGVSHE